jgi:NADP-dependent alcohol dehydrogenase
MAVEKGIRNFEFQNPTKIVFGKDRIKKIDELIPTDAKVLVLYGGGSVKKFGTFDRVVKALGDRQWDEFGGIEANPTYETLIQAVDKVKAEGFDYLMAVGGGSVIDGAKFVAAGAVFDGNPIDIFGNGVGKGLPVTKAVPFGTVLTLPATASEMNNNSVVTFVGKQAKISFASAHTYPQFSILEPELTYSLPKRQLANGIIDSFVHTMEAYLTYPIDARVQDRWAEGLLQTLIEIGPDVVDEDNHDYALRANFMWTATNALNRFISQGVPQDWASHALGHELTLAYHIDHARTLSIVLPAMMKVRKKQKWEKLLQYAERVWNIKEGSDEEKIDVAILKTEEFFAILGAPIRFSDVGLKEDAIPGLVAGLVRHDKVNISERSDLSAEDSYAVYKEAL